MSVTILPPPPSASANNILQQQQQTVNQLNYIPIDIPRLQREAEQTAGRNAARSLALEAQLAPGVSAARSGLQSQVAENLALRGALPADVQNQVSRESAGQAGASGLLGSHGPITAANLGLTSLSLQNPTPLAGLDPATVFNANVASNNQRNNFELAKIGAQGNIANSQLGQIQSELSRGASAPGISLWDTSMGSYQPTSSGGNTASYDLQGNPIIPGQLSVGQQAALQRQQSNNAANNSRLQTTALYGPGY